MAKNSISKISNAFSTGGGGVNFEQQIQAMFLLSLLIDGFCPAMNEQTKKVHFQAKHLGHDVDDLVVITYRNQSEGKMACQIKHSITATEKDKTFNSYECYVKPLASWNSEIITSVLSLASDLIDNNHADRAEALLYNWFYDVTLEQIYDCVKVNDGNDDGWLSPEYRNIGNLIGKTACATQSTFLLKNLSELCEKSRSFTGAVCDSAMRSAFKYLVGNDLYSTLADIELILLDTLVEEIKLLLSSNRINDLRQTEIIFREKLQKKPAGLLISLFVQIITDNICFSVEQHKSFLEQIDTIELPNTMVERSTYQI